MSKRVRLFLSGVLMLASCARTSMPAVQLMPGDSASSVMTMTSAQSAHVCQDATMVTRTCFALRRTDLAPLSQFDLREAESTASTVAYGPPSLEAAYSADVTQGAGQTVAIVDAYDDPNADFDLETYRSYYKLPACRLSTGCLQKVNETGGAALPRGDVAWGQEISADLDMVSAICPLCHIVLVEANSPSNSDLDAAVEQAGKMHAQVISNSYGGPENIFSNSGPYNQPGSVVVAAAGDSGYGPNDPAAFATVVAVGGTHLVRLKTTAERKWSESAWSCTSASQCGSSSGGTGSGCSVDTPKPSWQTDTGCKRRSESDISAVADPATGVYVFDSYGVDTGFYVFGGTSVATPIVAAMFALAGNAATLTAAGSGGAPKHIWQTHSSANLNDVISGENAPSPTGMCSVRWMYICVAGTGYDGPSGWGSPNGTGAL